jgi:hypothetical protein
VDVSKQDNREGNLRGLRTVPTLPIRAGRHLTAWVLWHTARVHLHHDDLATDDRPASMRSQAKRPV